MNEIVKPFKESLFDTSFQEFAVDVMELGIDSVLKDGSLRDVPIVRTIVGLANFAANIHDRYLLTQTLIFIQEFNKNAESEDVKKHIAKYKREIDEDPKKAERELGRVMVILNRIIDDTKTLILSKLYLSYIEKNLEWSEFCDLSEVTEKIFTTDISVLKDIYSNNPDFDENKLHNYQRLVSVGLLKNDSKFDSGTSSVMFVPEDGAESTKMELTLLGSQFAKIVSDILN